MKKKLSIIGIGILSITIVMGINIKNEDQQVCIIDNAKYITIEDENLDVYNTIHELSHSVVNTDQESVELIAPTKEARKIAWDLVEREIYMKDNISMYNKIGYIVEKFYYGLIDEDLIKMHNIISKESNFGCSAISLNTQAIERIITDDTFFDDEDRINYNRRLNELTKN